MMSYDVSIGGFDANYTSNLAEFFHDHIKDAENTGLQALHNKAGKDAAILLAAAFDHIHDTFHRMGEDGMRAKYDAANGWGSVIGAMTLLGRTMAACQANPRKLVYLSC